MSRFLCCTLVLCVAPVRADPPAERLPQLERLGATRSHNAGFHGQGIKVAILDSGFRGYRTHLGSALPKQVSIHSFRNDGDLEARDSAHGVLCAEVVHALAPKAELLLANWEPDDPRSFLRAVHWAREQGANIVTCSVVMPGWSDGRGGGSVHTELAKLLGTGLKTGDLLGFASAGNVAQRHWSGPYRDSGGFHEWRAGAADNALIPWGVQPVSVEITHPTGAAYRLHVLDAADGTEIGQVCRLPADGIHGGAVRFVPESGRRYRVRVERVRGEPGDFRLVVLGGSIEFSSAKGSIVFPGDGASILAVGAVDADGRRFPYSCCGRDTKGLKPDFVAPVPFASAFREAPFTGTSAAAPQAAALAALAWSRHPDWAAGRVRDLLKKSCLDVAAPGPDCETGLGMIRLE